MKEDSMLKCLIAFILGWLVSRMMGNVVPPDNNPQLKSVKSKHNIFDDLSKLPGFLISVP